MNHDWVLQLLEQRAEIDGRFSGFQRLGVGAFSAVVSARDATTGDKVALKVCLPQQDRYRIASFERESDLLALLLGEPDIVQLVSARSTFTEVLTAQGGVSIPFQFQYYAVELAHSDLGTVIHGNGWNAEKRLLAFRTLCRAVQRIHARRIPHRDLKPSNLLVMPDQQVKLSDFGTARLLDSKTSSLLGQYQGPPGDRRYCAPELLACLHDEDPFISLRADFFSLGAILFEMFSGTILGLQLFKPRFWGDIASHMLAVKPGHRVRTYDQIVTSISNSRPLPSVASFGAAIPTAIREPVDDLYRALSTIDYRKRLCEFDRIFNKVNICLLILRNQTAYQRWLDVKKRRRATQATRSGELP